jgi:hypothetical protein
MRIAFVPVTALILLRAGAAAQEISNDYSKADFAHSKHMPGRAAIVWRNP